MAARVDRLAAAEVFGALGSRPDGLRAAEVRDRLVELGPNLLRGPRRLSAVRRLVRQFANFFCLLLVAAAALSLVADRLRPQEGMAVLGWALLAVALLNGIVAFVQEHRAERAMQALRRFLPQAVTVLRSGREERVPAAELVPGDVIRLTEGDQVPADARIVEEGELLVSNAPLTGESRAVRMRSDAVDAARLTDAPNLLFAGCAVLRGTASAVVFATGGRTELGRIAALTTETQRGASPIEREVNHMIRVLTGIAVAMGAAFLAYGIATGRDLVVNVVFTAGIIVANVPEGLLPTYTLALAMAGLRMARRKVLVRSLGAVEALGAVQVICTDKTGTLTRNELRVADLADPLTGEPFAGNGWERVLRAAVLASDIRRVGEELRGDPLDVAIARAADLAAIHPAPPAVRRFPFDVSLRRQGAVGQDGGRSVFALKGAWEAIAPLVSSIASAGEELPMTAEHRARVEATVGRLSGRGLRVIAVASRPLGGAAERGAFERDGLERDLALLGLVCVEDPLRDEVPAAVARCRAAGIRVLMITGDHPATALAVAVKAGIVGGDEAPAAAVLRGEELETLTTGELEARLAGGLRVLARTTPEQKLKVVLTLQAMGRIVAMTGDGVNDAPALKAADVGVAMGSNGTDVAREAAQIVLLDDSFASIVAAIEEGRAVFANLRRFTTYVLASNGPEIVPYLLYIALPVPLALGVVQILWIDLGTDMLPAMALGREPPGPGLMERPPRGRRERLLRWSLLAHAYLFLGLIEAAFSLALFFLVLGLGGWSYGDPVPPPGDPLVRSGTGIALSAVFLMQVGNYLALRSDRPRLDLGFLGNRLAVVGLGVEVVLSFAILYIDPVARAFGTGPVEPGVYLLAWLGLPLLFGADWLRKRLLSPRGGSTSRRPEAPRRTPFRITDARARATRRLRS